MNTCSGTHAIKKMPTVDASKSLLRSWSYTAAPNARARVNSTRSTREAWAFAHRLSLSARYLHCIKYCRLLRGLSAS